MSQQRKQCERAIITRQLPDRLNPFTEFDDFQFAQRFRFSKRTVEQLLIRIQPHLEKDPRGSSIPPNLQLLAALRFFATGGFYRTIGDSLGLSSHAVGKIIYTVSHAIAKLKPEFIQLDRQAPDFAEISRKFYSIAGFPGIIGAIDCTHIEISCPSNDSRIKFWCSRKAKYTLNVQVIGDSQLRIRNIVARWPGSTHDARIFTNSEIFDRLEAGEFGDTHLIGDAGYPCKPFLLTPYSNPQSGEQFRYNSAHVKSRSVIERLFGIWKRRFACLEYGLRCNLDTSLTVIIAVAVLHNMGIKWKDEWDEYASTTEEITEEEEYKCDHESGKGRNKRELIATLHFGSSSNN